MHLLVVQLPAQSRGKSRPCHCVQAYFIGTATVCLLGHDFHSSGLGRIISHSQIRRGGVTLSIGAVGEREVPASHIGCCVIKAILQLQHHGAWFVRVLFKDPERALGPVPVRNYAQAVLVVAK